jgi:hypothetical protein
MWSPLHEPGDARCLTQRLSAAASETTTLRAHVSSQAREIERIKGRMERVLRYAHGYFGHMGTGVWSRRRSGGAR